MLISEGCSEDYMYLFFIFFILDKFILVHGSSDHIDICKVEFYQPSCLLNLVPNLLVF